MTELPPHVAAYVNEIQSQLRRFPHTNFVVISDAESAELLQARLAIDALGRMRFVAEELVEPDFLPSAGEVVIVTHAHRAVAHAIHRRLTRAKQAGAVVTLALRDRRLQTHPPGWDGVGIMYEGMFRIAATYCVQLPRGSYAEFGVFDGNTFAVASHALSDVCDKFYAYDSFAGIVGSMASENTVFSDGDYFSNLETFKHNMQRAGVDLRRVVGVRGPFQETLRKTPAAHGLERVSVAHIDVDVYEPAKLALDYLSAVLQQGAILLFDDYDQMGASNRRGERRAVGEWLAENPGFSLEPYRNYAITGRAFLFDRGD